MVDSLRSRARLGLSRELVSAPRARGTPAERMDSRRVSNTKSLVNCAKPPPRLQDHTGTTSDSQSPSSVMPSRKSASGMVD